MSSDVELPDDESDLSGYEDSDGDIDLESSQERPVGSDSEESDADAEPEYLTESELSLSQSQTISSQYSTESDSEFIDDQGWGRLNVSHGHLDPGRYRLQEGPTTILPHDATPLDYFHQQFPESLIDRVVEETNRYARQKNLVSWENTDISEMKAFLGMIIGTSYTRISRLEDIWSQKWSRGLQMYASIMPKNRFTQLWSCIHFNDNDFAPVRGSPDYDRLYKIRPIIEKCKEKFKANYNLPQKVTVDELIIKFKGRCSINQYDPSKPIKRGFKVWSLSSAEDKGYLWDFNVYTGRTTPGTPERNLAMKAVTGLCVPSLNNKANIVHTDRYFTSVPLFDKLKESGIFACGTINLNRCPRMLKNAPSLNQRGDYSFVCKEDGTQAIAWKDSKMVCFLNSAYVHTSHVYTVPRCKKDGTQENVPCPPAVKMYNLHINGIDVFDQHRSYYGIDRKSKRWPLRIFWHLVDSCIVNAHFLYRKTVEMYYTNLTVVDQLDFRTSLVEDGLVGGFTSRKRLGRPPVRNTDTQQHKVEDLRVYGHDVSTRCRVCLASNKRHETYYGCHSCGDVHLCRPPKPCFITFHRQ